MGISVDVLYILCETGLFFCEPYESVCRLNDLELVQKLDSIGFADRYFSIVDHQCVSLNGIDFLAVDEE